MNLIEYGYIRVAAAIPTVKVADCRYNADQILSLVRRAESEHVSIVSFPELSITGYTCGDLFSNDLLLKEAVNSLKFLLEKTADTDVIAIVGMPVEAKGLLFNAAVVFQKGRILGIVPKTFLPNYKEFYEKRWFASSIQTKEDDIVLCGQTVPMQANLLFETNEATFAVEICEDLWATIPPGALHALNGAELIFNLSADNEALGKHDHLHNLVSQQAARCIAGYVFSSCGFGESTTDVVFAGNGIINEAGHLLAESKRFSMESQLVVSEIDLQHLRSERRCNTTFAESRGLHAGQYKTIRIRSREKEAVLSRPVSNHPFISDSRELDKQCADIFAIQTAGLIQRLSHTGSKNIVIGISGGLDSTLALLVCVHAFDKLHLDRKGIVAVTMPGFGTTDRTYINALSMMQSLGVTIREIPIKAACLQHFSDIGHNPDCHDITFENSQARERTQILMDIANQTGGMVVGTGDLSELALGWATYNGDHMSMYGVNASVPKTLVRHIVVWIAETQSDEKTKQTLLDIVDTPISPELIPADMEGKIRQKTEDIVGPYELHDFFLYHMMKNGASPAKIYFLARNAFKNEFDNETLKKWLTNFCRRFFTQQFKRSCLPDGPKIDVSLSPRGDWKMPSDATVRMWLDECNNL